VSVLLCVGKLYLKLECEIKKWSFRFCRHIRNDQYIGCFHFTCLIPYFVAFLEFILERSTVSLVIGKFSTCCLIYSRGKRYDHGLTSALMISHHWNNLLSLSTFRYYLNSTLILCIFPKTRSNVSSTNRTDLSLVPYILF
jgi:hypothetical protein